MTNFYLEELLEPVFCSVFNVEYYDWIVSTQSEARINPSKPSG
jgi:hypothetical protein